MRDINTTKEQLISELVEVRQRITELEALEAHFNRAEKELRKERNFSMTLVHLSPAFFVTISADGKTMLIPGLNINVLETIKKITS